jgi:hypothetical protein
VQAGLNNAASVRMQGKCPKEVFLGLPSDSPLVSIKAEREGKVVILSLSEIRAAQLLKAQEVLRAVEGMHKEVAGLVSKSRQRAIAAHNAKTHVRAHNFDVGDFVLSAVLSRNRKSKLSLQWTGPHRVTKCSSDYIFEVQDLMTGGTCEVHGTRLKFYRNKGLEEDNELHEHLAYQQGELCAVERFTDIREHEGVLQLMAKWKGFGEVENTWEGLEIMRHDVPEMVRDFIMEMKDTGTPRQRALADASEGSQ